jgi:hypothetical protein
MYVAVIVISAVLVLVCAAAFVAIIWFERNATELKRVFINRMVSSASYSILAWLALVQVPEVLKPALGPWPVSVCGLHLLLRNAILVQVVLFYDALVAVRYLSIFVMADPLSFDNDFWTAFANAFVVVFSLITQAAYVMLPGGQPLDLVLCSGQSPARHATAAGVKVNWQLIAILGASFVLHVGANLRIKVYKIRHKTPCCNVTAAQETEKRSAGISAVEKLVISDCVANFFILVAIVAVGALTVHIDGLDPEESRHGAKLFVVVFGRFFAPFLFIGTVAGMYFTRNRPLREAVIRKIRNKFADPDTVAAARW